MSISYSAYVVIGFELTVREAKVNQTKYNEDTGEPFKVDVHSHNEGVIDGVSVVDDRENVDCFCAGESFEGLDITASGYESGTKVLGVILAKCSEYEGDCKSFKAALPEAVVIFAKKHGVIPNLFLIQSCG